MRVAVIRDESGLFSPGAGRFVRVGPASVDLVRISPTRNQATLPTITTSWKLTCVSLDVIFS